MDLAPYLEKLENAIDPEHVAEARKRQEAALCYREVDHLPQVVGCPISGWQGFSYSEGFREMEKMLVNELGGAYVGALVGDDRPYAIRANYGVGILPSLFGCKTRLIENQMPYAEALSPEELDAALEAGPPEITSGLGARVFETEEFYLKALGDYPRLCAHVHVYLCDTQGPFDAAHLVMGHDIYTEIYDNPARVHRLLELVTDAIIRFSRAQKELVGESGDWHVHGPCRARGGVRICEDSCTNISAAAYEEFARPYNEKILAAFHGGWIHYCGRGHQILESALDTPGLCGINFGNPEYQEIPRVLALAQARKISVIGLPASAIEGLGVRTGISVMRSARSLEEARAIAGPRQGMGHGE